jgi:hypothetical protein
MLEWLIVVFSICLTLGIAAWATETDWRRLVVELKVWWLDFKRAGEPDHMSDRWTAEMAESQGEREPLKFRRR